jgi:hypothetical protein
MHFVVMTICGSFSCGFCLSKGNLFFMYKCFSTFHFGYPRKPFLKANFVFFYAFIPPPPPSLPTKHIGSFQRREICWLFWAPYYLALLEHFACWYFLAWCESWRSFRFFWRATCKHAFPEYLVIALIH